jgi:hypothetical protein
MTHKEQAQELVMDLTQGKLGMRYQESDGILIYANALTLIIDIGKWIKLKLNKTKPICS